MPDKEMVTAVQVRAWIEELSALSAEQSRALQVSGYARMPPSDKAAYDARRLRIGEIADLLRLHRLSSQ